MIPLFHDRREAGKRLAERLSAYVERDDVIVLALPRGGVPVAFEVAQHLHAPLDLMLVRKLGVPGQKELAMGAIALPDVCVFNHDVILDAGISQEEIDQVVAKEANELQRRNRAYRGGEPPPDLKDRIVILIDDGIATGATMHAAISAVAQQQPRRIVVAVPVAAKEAYQSSGKQADEVVSLFVPAPFFGVGGFYENFGQTSDEEVIKLLADARHWDKGSVHFDEKRRQAI
jgi:putative phosphoribosyl transferase